MSYIIEIPIDRPDTELEITGLIEPIADQDFDREEWHSFIERMAGCLADDPIERLPQGEYEKREPMMFGDWDAPEQDDAGVH